jgi:starch synthase
MRNFSLYFEPDGYVVNSARIMGRHSAGSGILRAAVAAASSSSGSISACVPDRQAAIGFSRLVKSISPDIETRTFAIENLALNTPIDGLYVPGPGMSRFASIRLRGKPDAFSIAGVTHTIASHAALTAIAELPDSALMPWDALICTSNAVHQSVHQVLEAKIDFLKWRLGLNKRPELPCLPVIPLGVHCDDFSFGHQHRNQARKDLGLNDDEIGLLFLGRLSFHAKAHPFPMFIGAESVVRQTRKKIVLIMCGWFANEKIKEAFVSAAREHFPSGKTLFIDGSKPDVVVSAWSGSDIFVSLSDNIQESFGLTPIEAMASGLPVLVTDWNGYRDTVGDGVHGYRIPVVQGFGAAGEVLSRKYESGEINYDMYCGLSCVLVAADNSMFVRKLATLVENPNLRMSLGQAGQKHARENFDWKIIYQRYADLFNDLRKVRKENGEKWCVALPSTLHAAPDKQAPDQLFGHFATRKILLQDVFEVVTDTPTSLVSEYKNLSRKALFSFSQVLLPSEEMVTQLALHSGSTLQAFAIATSTSPERVITACVMLVKMGLLRLVPADNLSGSGAAHS